MPHVLVVRFTSITPFAPAVHGVHPSVPGTPDAHAAITSASVFDMLGLQKYFVTKVPITLFTATGAIVGAAVGTTDSGRIATLIFFRLKCVPLG